MVLGLLVTVVALAGLLVGFTSALSAAIEANRHLLNRYRAALGELTGTPVEVPYALTPQPHAQPPGFERRHRFATPEMTRLRALLKDPATARDYLWMLLNPLVTLALSAVPLAIACYGLVYLIIAGSRDMVTGSTGPEPRSLWQLAMNPTAALGSWVWLAVPAGLTLCGAVLVLGPDMLHVQAAVSRRLLGPTKAAHLAQRVRRLSETRAETTDAQAAELRRIERDLHDGAQSRLVATGMALRTMEHLLANDPEAARELLVEARRNCAGALSDLRDLVRGVHPPVLAERGLADALRGLALDTALPVTTEITLPGRPPAPIEAAVYFALCELLTNAAKHSRANQLRLTVGATDHSLSVTVTDDGIGGADPTRGSGLHGVLRRLAAFDGTMEVHSPPGGPTTITMEIPCVLSSPRTSTSCEPA
ncbi:sensor domain-containing protein (plasmid) [Streptomyces sp. BHT-5-2]|nr:sensor domain-containing protein [Streptomyces sp. BHT-5-2]